MDLELKLDECKSFLTTSNDGFYNLFLAPAADPLLPPASPLSTDLGVQVGGDVKIVLRGRREETCDSRYNSDPVNLDD